MDHPNIVSREEWFTARKALLAKEKELIRQRDAVSAARRALPCVKVEKEYVFEGPEGKVTLRDLFRGKRQLIVYHFMYDPAWEEGCKSCSLLAEGFQGVIPHLGARDVSFAAISRAPLDKLLAFQKRMGWSFPWFSSGGTDFNFDFHVSFRPEDKVDGKVEYNYSKMETSMSDLPGLSVFLREGDNVLHTYSTYARGLDPLMETYNYLDLTPMGRNEEGLPYGMEWVRLHDRYEAT